ncbi:General L-amino acid-binding periplasmic protein AapJ precursor [bacterium YEK0313]|nr:General L-amino acid-binding periplasmic protein AapJ precursor [bacterium YEK0313]
MTTKRLKRALAAAALGLAGLMSAPFAAPATSEAQAQTANVLERAKQRGYLTCGIHTGLPGFGYQDDQQQWRGLDVDLCRAVAAAIFDDPTKIRFVQTTTQTRFIVVQTGDVDMLARNATYTLARDTAMGMAWPVINFFDGQGFIVRRSLNVTSVKGLSGATICVTQGTTTELNLADYFRSNNLNYEVVSFKTNEEGVKAFEAGRCDSFTTDSSGLAAERLKFANPNDFVILPELISREPLGPAVRRGDENFAAIVRWTHYAMLNAEDLGVTRANVAELARSTQSPEIRRLLGLDGKFGEAMGLSNDWALRIIRHVGNYGEVFERNVGAGSRLGLPRGLNALWSQGGQQYPYPIR